MISIVVADDQTLVRRGFVSILDSIADMTVVADAADGDQAVAAARRHRPDVMLMDVQMPGIDGIEATRRITADPNLHRTRIIILITFDLDEYVHNALRAGASGFLLKDTLPDDLIRAVRVVAAGDALIAPSITRRRIEQFSVTPAAPPGSDERLSALTQREREVLQLVAQGLSNHEIADTLHLGTATIKTHIGRLLMKLVARDRAQLVVTAYETRLVEPKPR
jgi:DNA-binding NarL/FixJ family response regulator